MQSGQRNARACKLSLETRRRRLTEGWMKGGREAVVSISLAGPAHCRALITCMTRVSEAKTQHGTDCRGVTDHRAADNSPRPTVNHLRPPVFEWMRQRAEGRNVKLDKVRTLTKPCVCPSALREGFTESMTKWFKRQKKATSCVKSFKSHRNHGQCVKHDLNSDTRRERSGGTFSLWCSFVCKKTRRCKNRNWSDSFKNTENWLS